MPLGALADAAMLARVRQQLRLSPADIDVIGSFQPPRSNRQNTSGPAPPLFLINGCCFVFFLLDLIVAPSLLETWIQSGS